MNKIVFLTIIAMIAGAGSLQAQKKGGKTQPKAQTKVQTKVQPATERKPKTAEIDSLIRCYLFSEAEDLISSELEGQPSADYAAKLRARKAQAEKGRAMPLAVSGAFHSPYMAEAAKGLEEFLKDTELSEYEIPLYSNYTAQPYEGDYVPLVTNQCKNPVKWQKTIENMITDGVDTFIEVGVGKTLSGLIKKINSDVKVFKVENKADLDALEI